MHVAVSAVASFAGFHASATPLTRSVRQAVLAAHEWHTGCPVPLSHLRVLSVTYRGFDGVAHTGRLVVNESRSRAAQRGVFRRLYALAFPIRHMALSDTYGPASGRPGDDDITASFECRQASSSPCKGGQHGTGNWSEHAYGEAIDLNPVENPYVGCGMTRDKTALSFVDRPEPGAGMVTPAVVAAFRAGPAGAGAARLDGIDEGLHALLGDRSLTWTGPTAVSCEVTRGREREPRCGSPNPNEFEMVASTAAVRGAGT